MGIPTRVAFLLFVIFALFAPDVTLAYGGPGSVISGIGAALAAIAALLASLFGFIWFPLKRLYKSMTRGCKWRGNCKPAGQVNFVLALFVEMLLLIISAYRRQRSRT